MAGAPSSTSTRFGGTADKDWWLLFEVRAPSPQHLFADFGKLWAFGRVLINAQCSLLEVRPTSASNLGRPPFDPEQTWGTIVNSLQVAQSASSISLGMRGASSSIAATTASGAAWCGMCP